ncbi:MAG: helix-loop-helix domain-containing protein [Gammaproteobacteria bacterium]|nr:helix-loop-helix domain-containing protein [Gammaproteobacteria bacterium]
MARIDHSWLLDAQELKSKIPTFPYERRLSKIDALNLAIAYIALLEDLRQTPNDPNIHVRKMIENYRLKKSPQVAWTTSGLILIISTGISTEMFVEQKCR